MVLQWTAEMMADVFLQLACGVKHLHACGVVHRDLKSDNALISSTVPLVVKWADFGCSVQLAVAAGPSTYGPDGVSFLSLWSLAHPFCFIIRALLFVLHMIACTRC